MWGNDTLLQQSALIPVVKGRGYMDKCQRSDTEGKRTKYQNFDFLQTGHFGNYHGPRIEGNVGYRLTYRVL